MSPKTFFIPTVVVFSTLQEFYKNFPFVCILPMTNEWKLNQIICNHSFNKLVHHWKTIYNHIQSRVSHEVFYIWDFINFTPSTNCFNVSSLISLSLVSVLESSLWLLQTRWNYGVLQKLKFGKLLSTFSVSDSRVLLYYNNTTALVDISSCLQ